jgi:hypothetical protein
VTLSESALTIIGTSPVILDIGDDGMLTVREQSALETTLVCSCEKDPSPNSTRLGFCKVSISKSRKTATCKAQDCSGSCVFERVDN